MNYNLKKKYFLQFIFLTVLIVILSFVGCSNQNSKEADGDIDLYFIDSNKTKLVTMSYKLKSDVISEKIQEIIEQMNKKSHKINYLPVIPDTVKIIDTYIMEKTLYIDFDANYQQMGVVDELLCHSALVLTMTQLEEIDYVSFTVNKNQLTDLNGKSRNNMKASDFVDNSGSSINAYQELNVILYYANKAGDKLIPTNYSGIFAQNTSVEKFIIDRLIKGPTDTDLYRTLPSSLKLISVTTKDGICYVNFDSTFLEDKLDITPQVQLYSVVNSLAELAYVNKVQISINGETDKKFRDYIILQDSLNRNLDIIAQ